MRPRDKRLSEIPRVFLGENNHNTDHQQVISFLYNQLIDGFIFFKAKKPVDWKHFKTDTAKLKVLVDGFNVYELNDALLKQTGYDRKAILGLTTGGFFGTQINENIRSFKKLIREGEVFAEFELIKPNNDIFWIEANLKFLFDEQGRTTGLLGIQRDITKRKAAFKAYEESKEQLRKLTSLSYQAMIIHKDGKIIDINEALVRLTGYDRKELLDTGIFNCFSESDQKKIFFGKKKDNQQSLETVLVRKDQSVVPVEVLTQKIVYDKHPVNVIGISDISNRKEIEEEILKLSVALDQSANEIIITTRDGKIEYINKSFTDVTGYAPHEVIGKNPRILKSGTHPPLFYKNLWKTLIKGQQWKGVFHNRKKNGTLYWESATITPIKNKADEIIRYIAIKEDITLRKIAEDSLRESEEKFRSMVSNIPGVVYRCAFDNDLTVYFISEAIENLAGYQAEDIQYNNNIAFSAIIHPEDRTRILQSIKEGIADFQQFSLEYRIVTKQNTIRWVSNNGRSVFDSDKKIKWLDGFLFDITERVTVLEELQKAKIVAEEANNAKSEFLANISHEIRTPLNSVLGFTELLEALTTDEVQVKYLNSIKASGKNLMMLINDLLDLSKIESGKITLNYTFFDIRRLLDEIHNVFSLKISIKGINYKETVSDDFPREIKFDEVRLRQILINLAGNAVKFTHEGSIQIIVKGRYKSKAAEKNSIKLEICVVDTGIGIPEESYKVIFQSFRQQSQLDSRKYGGTGLGLAITKRLVEAMNGRISLKSTIGKGSTFRIVFPNVECSERPPMSEFPDNRSKGKYVHRSLEGRHKTDLPGEELNDLNIVEDAEYHLLLHRFENELNKKWEMFQKKQPLKEIKSFAIEISNLGRNYKLDLLVDYGEQLMSTIENFEIEEMRHKLNYFPGLLSKLKKIGYEHG